MDLRGNIQDISFSMTGEPQKKDPFDAFETFAAHQNEGGIKNEEDLANMVEDIVKKILEEKEKED